MTTDDLYDRICSVHPVDRSSFEEDLLWITDELCAMFGKKNVLSLDSSPKALPVKGEYQAALCSAILFTQRGEEDDRLLFLERAKSAFLEVWRQRAAAKKRGEIQ